MILQISFLQRIFRRFLDRNVKYPPSEQPLFDVEGLALTQEDIAREYSTVIRERYGPLPEYQGKPYKFVIRETQFAGLDPEAIKVTSEYFLTGNYTVVGNDGVVYTFSVSSPSGKKYDAAYFDKQIKGKMGQYFDNKSAMYDYLESAVIKANWYLTRFIPKK